MTASARSAPSSNWLSRGFNTGIMLIAASAVGLLASVVLWMIQTHRQERVAEATAFIETAQRFDMTVRAYMTLYLNDKPADAAREAVQKNIQEQYLALERAANMLDGERWDYAERYHKSLVVVSGELDRDIPAAEAKGLLKSIAVARGQNICVTFYLRDEAGMETSARDEKDCGPRGVLARLGS